jgi:hypothetical protein
MPGSRVPMVDTVDRNVFGGRPVRLGEGGQAIVYDLPGFRLPGVADPMVYKEYRSTNGVPANLDQIVAVRQRLGAPQRARLDAVAVWPLAVVTENGMPCGVVMRRVPAAFFDDMMLPSGKRGEGLREVQNLFIDPARATWLGRPAPSTDQRLAVCRDFASALSFYHDELSVVFGDINALNELFRLDSDPKVLFLDCDGVRLKGFAPTARQLNAPDWDPPESGPLTQATDLYKLGLFILRCLSPGAFASTHRDPATVANVLDPTCLDLLQRSLAADPLRRPMAREWWIALSGMLGDPVVRPALGAVRPDRPFVLSGQHLPISWTATDAVVIEATAGGRVVRVDGSAGTGVISVPLDGPCMVSVRAMNKVGDDSVQIGPIAVVPPPPMVRSLPVPMPVLRPSTPPQMSPTLGPPPAVDLPEVPFHFTDLFATSTTTWSPPVLGPVSCPLDLVSLMIDGPEVAPGLLTPLTGGTS